MRLAPVKSMMGNPPEIYHKRAGWGTDPPAPTSDFFQTVAMSSEFRELLETFHHTGTVRWIGLRSGRRMPVVAVESVECTLGQGLVGDRYSGKAGGRRMVTLIQAEHLGVVATLLGRDHTDPALIRRNIVVGGINLHALRKQKFQIGDVVLQGTGDCEPCSHMEEALGPGGYQAMRGHGGITATVLQAGTIRVGDTVTGIASREKLELA